MAGLVKLHCGNRARDEWPVWAVIDDASFGLGNPTALTPQTLPFTCDWCLQRARQSFGCSPNNSPPPVALGCMTGVSANVRKEAGVTIAVEGVILTGSQAETILADGKADLVAIGHGMLDDPKWGHQAIAARACRRD